MSSIRRTPFAAKRSSHGGFTLVELLVVIGIIAILASVALGPITSGIKTAQHNAAMQNSRSIALICFQYAVDNGNYPSGTNSDGTTVPGGNTSQGVAQQLLQGKYTSDPTIFYYAAQGKAKYAGNGDSGQFTSFGSNNITWDFMAITGSGTPAVTGITSSASDLLPLVWCSGNPAVTPPVTAGNATSLQLTSQNPFALDGIAVTYKSNSAVFMRADANGIVQGFIPAAYNDTTTYVDLKPQ
jgi:prepilin-type N-terminal cleavage/methylation domain-containing protein